MDMAEKVMSLIPNTKNNNEFIQKNWFYTEIKLKENKMDKLDKRKN